MLLLGLGIGTSSASSLTLINEISLLLAFAILAAFTYTSGLRGTTLTGVFKDALIWFTVIVSIIAIPIFIGGFHTAFSDIKAPAKFLTLPSSFIYYVFRFNSFVDSAKERGIEMKAVRLNGFNSFVDSAAYGASIYYTIDLVSILL